MSLLYWSNLFKYLMDICKQFFNIIILPGTDITILDFMLWCLIIYLLLKTIYSIYK